MTPDITLRSPDDVVAALPYQLGYHPVDSVVLVALDDRRVGLVARCDLPPAGAVGRVTAALVEPVVREGFGAVVLVGYEEVRDASHPVLAALVDALEAAEVVVLDVAVVRGGRRYSPTCSEACCPPEGALLPDPAGVPAVAELVGLGRAPLASRDAVGHCVRADPGASRGVAEALRRASGAPRPAAAARAWARVLARPGGAAGARDRDPWPPGVVADAALGLAEVDFRDALVGWLVPGVLPPGDLDRAALARLESVLPRWAGMGGSRRRARVEDGRDTLLERLLLLCRSVPDACPDAAAAVCTVAAHVAWSDGEGAIAREALDRALRLAPEYRLAGLLARLVDHGLRLTPGERPEGGLSDRAG